MAHSSSASLPPGLIINADDLGIHPQISAGILSAYRNGVLTSCTMLLTTAYLEETVHKYVRPAELPIGLHLSLTLGKAVAHSHDVADLVDEQGNLKLSAAHLIMASFGNDGGRKILAQIRTEFEAQLALARDWSINATHADSHQHVHMNPNIYAIVEDLLPRYGISRLRFCREAFAVGIDTLFATPLARLNLAKWAMLRWRCAQISPRLAVSDDFFGVLYSGSVNRVAIERLVARVSQNRSLEVCIHPGFPAPRGKVFYPRPGYNNFISSPARQAEHDLLIAPEVRDLVRRRGLILRSFDGRPKS